jgi:hypothetical protein
VDRIAQETRVAVGLDTGRPCYRPSVSAADRG